MRVIGIGDNVCDKYEHLRLMFPGGQAANFAVYAGMLGAESAYMGVFLIKKRLTPVSANFSCFLT